MKKHRFSYIFDDIFSLADKNGITLTLLETDIAQSFRQKIANTYPLIELSKGIEFYEGEGLQTDESYIVLPDYLNDSGIIFLIPEEQESRGIKFSRGLDLPFILKELNYFIEFAITDNDLSYLIGENHSGILMALGKAEEWLKTRK